MTRTKKFNLTRFKVETFRAARANLEKIAKAGKKVERSESFIVWKANGERWSYDSQEEFFAAYSDKAEWATYRCSFDFGRFGLEIEFRNNKTEISVAAESNEQIDTIINLFIEAQPGAALEPETPKAKEGQLADNDELPTFKCSKRLPSCYVDRKLIEQVESYILKEASRITKHPLEEVRSDYTLTITDQDGKESVNAVSQLESQQFHDSTSQINLEIHHRNGRIRFYSELTLDRRRNWTELETIISSIRAREDTSAFVDGIVRRTSQQKTFNWIFISNDPVGDVFYLQLVLVPCLQAGSSCFHRQMVLFACHLNF